MTKYFTSTFMVSTDYEGIDILQMIDAKRKTFNDMQLVLVSSGETSYNNNIQRKCLECDTIMVSGFMKGHGIITETSRCNDRCGYNEKIIYNLESGEVKWETWFDEDEQDEYIEKEIENNKLIEQKRQDWIDENEVKEVELSDEEIDYLDNFDVDELLE